MKVNELIEALSKLPQNLPVKSECSCCQEILELTKVFEDCDDTGEACVFLAFSDPP